MKVCMNCQWQCDDKILSCPNCGSEQFYPIEEQLNYNPEDEFVDNSLNNYQQTSPILQLATRRGLVKYLLLSLITLGIYGLVTMCKISGEINIVASRYDGRRTMHYLGMTSLMAITLFIYPFVWWHGLSNRIGIELTRRRVDYRFGAKDFWIWNVLGILILIGPLVYIHKLMKAMNYINQSYNYYG